MLCSSEGTAKYVKITMRNELEEKFEVAYLLLCLLLSSFQMVGVDKNLIEEVHRSHCASVLRGNNVRYGGLAVLSRTLSFIGFC